VVNGEKMMPCFKKFHEIMQETQVFGFDEDI
jgi:hypothetical protein